MLSDVVFKGGGRVVIIGPRKSGKSSIALGLSCEQVNQQRGVMYICNKEKIESGFPLIIESNGISTLGGIRMHYLTSSLELKALLASISFSDVASTPIMIVIEDLSTILLPGILDHRNNPCLVESITQIIYLLKDTTERLDVEGEIKLVITDSYEEIQYLYALKRCADVMLHLSPCSRGSMDISYFDLADGKLHMHSSYLKLVMSDERHLKLVRDT